MNRLTQIANKYFTDKGSEYTQRTLFKPHDGFFKENISGCHNYGKYYEEFFSQYRGKEKVYILEIGTGLGGSTLAFDEYFDHNCEIYTLDIQALQYIDGINESTYPNIHYYNCNENNEDELINFVEFFNSKNIKFDIIIDDASHMVYHQMLGYKHFHKLLKDTGIYIIEDVHCSSDIEHYNLLYKWENVDKETMNAIDFFINFKPYDKFDKNTNLKLLKNIDNVVLINTSNVNNQTQFYLLYPRYVYQQRGMSLIITHKLPKYNFYACSYDGNDYTDRFPNISFEQIDYKDCHNDLDNIRLLYSEVYHIYDIWKNEKLSDYIGICHYRRFFDFNYDKLDEIFNNYDIILPNTYDFGISVYKQYCRNFDPNNIKILGAIIKKYYPDYLESFCDFFNQNNIHANNMMITSKKIYNDYCTWLFDILNKFSKYCKFNSMDDVREYIMKNDHAYHCEDGNLSVLDKEKLSPEKYEEWLTNYSRIYGFLAERLLNVYVIKNKLKVLEVPIKIYD